MQEHIFDYLKYIQPSHAAEMFPDSNLSIQELYGDHAGITYNFDIGGGRGYQEVVQLRDDIVLLFGQADLGISGVSHQKISKSDWIHVQFCIEGEGYEEIGNGELVTTSSKSCIVTRYDQDSVITREAKPTNHWRTACLFFRPECFSKYFGIAPSALSNSLHWMVDVDPTGAQSIIIDLHPMATLAINDMFSCPLRDSARRTYMKAKALELVSVLVHCLKRSDLDDSHALKMSAQDKACIEEAQKIISTEFEEPITLAQLARKVGVNRSKLAYGFKAIYGTSVQAYWRDVRLNEARHLLQTKGLSITEVSGMVGYADSSCFTRAFVKKFGILPKYCRQNAVDSHIDSHQVPV